MTKSLLGALLAALIATLPTMAAEYPFVVTNKTSSDITGISVRNGEVVGFKRIAQGGERSFSLSLPNGCDTRITVHLNDADSVIIDNYDACNSGGVDVFY
jgi:hypothetical protein